VEDMLKLLLERVMVPAVDFVLNCSDFPAVSKHKVRNNKIPDVPVLSMCGSTLHNDIIVPTYMLATNGLPATIKRARLPWRERKPQLVRRGRASNSICRQMRPICLPTWLKSWIVESNPPNKWSASRTI